MVPFLAFLALAAWALASPVGSSPDDDFHLPSIWCGLGERQGLCEPGSSPETRAVPKGLVGEPCYARHATKNASCWSDDKTLVETGRVNNVSHLYPPAFYATMSVFASTNIEASVIAMRLFNAALFVGLVTATAFALPSALRRSAVIPFAVTMVPLGVFCVASTNPSSWTYMSAGVVWLALYGSTRTNGRRRLVLAGLAVLATLIGAGARADAAVYACVAVGAVVVLSLRRSRDLLVPAITSIAIVLIGAFFYFTSAQGGDATAGLTDKPPLGPLSTVKAFLDMPNLWFGASGGWGLGWFDVPMPWAVPVLGWAIIAGSCMLGLGIATRRTGAAAAVILAVMWLMPTYLQRQTGTYVGTWIQPRYILPLLIILVGLLTLSTDRGTFRWSRGQGYVAVCAIGLAWITALFTTIRRFAVGINKLWTTRSDPHWWWSAGPGPVAVFVIGALATMGALLLCEHLGRTSANRATAQDFKAPNPRAPLHRRHA